jgi:hypothetical protein
MAVSHHATLRHQLESLGFAGRASVQGQCVPWLLPCSLPTPGEEQRPVTRHVAAPPTCHLRPNGLLPYHLFPIRFRMVK